MSNPYIVKVSRYRQNPIREYPDGAHSSILDRSLLVMNAAINCFRRAYFVRMDLKFPDDNRYPSDNRLIRLFMEEFRLERMKAGYDFFYVWVWEQNTSINHHYHCCFCFNYSETQNLYGHVAAARIVWAKLLGLIPPNATKKVINKAAKKAPVWDCTKDKDGNPQKNGLLIDINAADYDQQYAKCFKWMSYLAKVYTKEGIPDGQRKMGSTMLRLGYRSLERPRPRPKIAPRPRPRLVIRPMVISGQVVEVPEIQ
jgi:hypothetical protein